MQINNYLIKIIVFVISIICVISCTNTNLAHNIEVAQNSTENTKDTNYISHIVNLKKQNLKFYWKNDSNKPYSNFKNLKTELEIENKELVFAMNGGMYLKDQSPQGLYIEKGLIKAKIDNIKSAYGNFYMQPNGIFYTTTNKTAHVCTTEDFILSDSIMCATQSGPMLLINGKMHPKFIDGSSSLYIRNGVGILPNGNILFAMSKTEVNFFDFTSYFSQNGCKNALYLDGFVSRTYLPSKNWGQTDGKFGVIIGETK